MVKLRYRITDGRKFRKEYKTDIWVNAKYWLASQKLVSSLHPNSEDVNRQLKALKDKIFEATNKFNTKRFNREQVINYIEGKSDYSSLKSYVETVLKDVKSNQTYVNYRGNLNAVETAIGRKLTFELLHQESYQMFEKFYNISKQRIKEGTFSAKSYNSYRKTISSICNHAKEYKAIHESIEVPKQFMRLSTNGTVEISSFTSEEFKDRIGEIKTIYDWKALSFWLLMFSLRGFYQADLVTMKEKNIEDGKKPKKGKRNETSRQLTKYWRDEQYLFQPRSKTNVEMLIKLHKTPILSLLEVVKNVIVYLDFPNPLRTDVVASINNKIEIYDYAPISNAKFHKNMWAKSQEKMRIKFEGLVFKTARKSYSTLMTKMGYKSEDINVQLGQSCQYLLNNSYVNYRDAELIKMVDNIHLKVLNEFKVDELRRLMFDKLKDVIQADNLPKWILGHTGVHKVGKQYKILVGMTNKMKPIWEEIAPEFREYFMADETKSNDFYTDIKEQMEYLGLDKKSQAERTKINVLNKFKNNPVYKELKEKQKENQALNSLLTKEGIETSS